MQTAEELLARVRGLFERAPFVRHLGLEPKSAGSGWCECVLVPEVRHQQQDGFVHAGVLATLADHTAAAAAFSVVPEDQSVVSVSFTVQLMLPAVGPLRCRGEVIRQGRSLIFADASVFAGHPERLVTRLNGTYAVVRTSDHAP